MKPTERRTAGAALLALAGLVLAGCQPEPRATDAATAIAEAEPARSTPTVVARRAPTPTPTVDPAAEPLFPVEIASLPDIPVPLAARAVEVVSATADTDVRVDFALPDDVDVDEVMAWYSEQMPLHGWDEGEERQGGLVFLNKTQLSARYAGEGLKRTATILFDTLSDDVDFSVLAEAAKP